MRSVFTTPWPVLAAALLLCLALVLPQDAQARPSKQSAKNKIESKKDGDSSVTGPEGRTATFTDTSSGDDKSGTLSISGQEGSATFSGDRESGSGSISGPKHSADVKYDSDSATVSGPRKSKTIKRYR